MTTAAAGLDDDPASSRPRPPFERYAEQWMHAIVHSPGPLPTVAPGQVWAHRRADPASITVLAVDRAAVWTDHGRTTVFRLLRDRRLVGPALPHDA